jgi:hypothetical protein
MDSDSWLFLAVLIYYFEGGAMFVLVFSVCFIALHLVIWRYVRFVVDRDAAFPKRVPFPLWLHLILALAALVPAWISAELIMWKLS